jgi:hypothetical protein
MQLRPAPVLPIRRRLAGVLAAVLAALAVGAWGASTASAVPSAVVHYAPSLPASLDQYAAPGNVIIVTAEQRNRNPTRLRAWRAKGAIVMAYVNLVDYIKPLDPIQNNLYGGSFPSAWFYPGNLSNWPGTRLLDLRASSAVATYNGFTGTWGQYAAHWIRNEVIKDGSLFNGVVLDVWGARLWGVPSVPSGPGSDWEAGIARWGQDIRNAVGPTVFIVGNNHQTRKTAQPLNGKMWESFDGASSGYNQLTGRGESEGLIYTFEYPEWDRPQLDILWRNEASPSEATKSMLVSSANRVTKTGTDIVVGSSDHQGGFPAPFGGGGGSAPPAVVLPGTPGAVSAPSSGSGGGAGGGKAKRSRVLLPLLRSQFERSGVTHPWTAVVGPKSRTKSNADGVTFMTGRSAKSFATATTTLSPQNRARVAVRLKITKMRLPRGQARALIALGAGKSHQRQVGVLRTTAGLVWASWRRTPSGGRVDLVKTKAKAKINRWVTVRIATDWRSRKTKDKVAVDDRVLLRPRAGRLAKRNVGQVAVGLGRASTSRELAAVVVSRITVAGSAA